MEIEQDLGRNQRNIASSIVYRLFWESITISNDYYSTTLYLPTCKVIITFRYSNSYRSRSEKNTLKVDGGSIAPDDELKA